MVDRLTAMAWCMSRQRFRCVQILIELDFPLTLLHLADRLACEHSQIQVGYSLKYIHLGLRILLPL